MIQQEPVIAARFRVHIRCENCVRDSSRILDVPAADDAPTSVEELVESEFLARQKFQCSACDSAIGTLVGVTTFRRREAA